MRNPGSFMRKILHLICYACTVLVEQTLWECDSPSLNPWLSYQNHTFHKLLYFFLTILNLHVTDKNSYDTPASAIVHSVFMIKTYRIIFKAFLTQLWKKQISLWKSYKIDIKLERANPIHAPSPPNIWPSLDTKDHMKTNSQESLTMIMMNT